MGGMRARDLGEPASPPYNPWKMGQGQLRMNCSCQRREDFKIREMAGSLEEIRAWREEQKRPPGNEPK